MIYELKITNTDNTMIMSKYFDTVEDAENFLRNMRYSILGRENNFEDSSVLLKGKMLHTIEHK